MRDQGKAEDRRDVIHKMNNNRIEIGDVRGNLLGSFDIRIASIVTTPMIIANGKLYAKPHVILWGFIKPTQSKAECPNADAPERPGGCPE